MSKEQIEQDIKNVENDIIYVSLRIKAVKDELRFYEDRLQALCLKCQYLQHQHAELLEVGIQKSGTG